MSSWTHASMCSLHGVKVQTTSSSWLAMTAGVRWTAFGCWSVGGETKQPAHSQSLGGACLPQPASVFTHVSWIQCRENDWSPEVKHTDCRQINHEASSGSALMAANLLWIDSDGQRRGGEVKNSHLQKTWWNDESRAGMLMKDAHKEWAEKSGSSPPSHPTIQRSLSLHGIVGKFLCVGGWDNPFFLQWPLRCTVLLWSTVTFPCLTASVRCEMEHFGAFRLTGGDKHDVNSR